MERTSMSDRELMRGAVLDRMIRGDLTSAEVRPLHSALRLGTVGGDELDAELTAHQPELSDRSIVPITHFAWRVIKSLEIGIDSTWHSVLPDPPFQEACR